MRDDMGEWGRARSVYGRRPWQEASPSLIDSVIAILVAAFLIVFGGIVAVFMALCAIAYMALSILVYFSPFLVVGAVLLWLLGAL